MMGARVVSAGMFLAFVLAHGEAAALLCANKKSGVVAVRTACKKKEVVVSADDLPDLRGEQGETGPVGPAGPAGPFTDTLPSGKTLMGAFEVTGTAAGASAFAQGAIAFGIPLAAAPTPHFTQMNGTPPAECPGTPAAPAAMPGHLCMFEALRTNVAVSGFNDPITLVTGSTVRRFGVLVGARSTAAGDFYSVGSWAVTAP